MAFSDDSVRAKLSALNESQESILWFEKLNDSNTSKKLNLIYLANEILQQAKNRRKDDFLVAFMPVIADATSTAYKGATQEVQNKIRRVVEVWRQRQVLEAGIQDATEARINELDKNRSSRSTGARLGGSLFGSSTVPTELQPLAQAHAALAKAETTAKPQVDKANTDYAAQHNPDAPTPSAPVQAGRLSSLMKTLANAEAAVNDSIKARTQLIDGLEKLLESHRGKLTQEEETRAKFSEQRADTEIKRKAVEDIIFQRVSAEDAVTQPISRPDTNGHGDPDHSPEVESFTPPPPDVEQLSPPAGLETDTYAADPIVEQPVKEEPAPAFEPPPAPGFDLLGSLSIPGRKTEEREERADHPKRRKTSHVEPDLDEQMFGAGAGIGLDDDVTAGL